MKIPVPTLELPPGWKWDRPGFEGMIVRNDEAGSVAYWDASTRNIRHICGGRPSFVDIAHNLSYENAVALMQQLVLLGEI